MNVAIVDYGSGNLHSAAQGLRARRARGGAVLRHRRDARPRSRGGARTISCCRASAPSPIAGAASTPCPAWSRRMTSRVRRTRAARSSAFASACSFWRRVASNMARREGLGWIARRCRRDRRRAIRRCKIPHMGWNTLDPRPRASAAGRTSRPGRRACTPISCIPIAFKPLDADAICRQRRLWRRRSPRSSGATISSARNSIPKRARRSGLA